MTSPTAKTALERAAAKRRQSDAAKGLATLRGVIDAYFEHRPELMSAATRSGRVSRMSLYFRGLAAP